MNQERLKAWSVILEAAQKASKLPKYNNITEFFEAGFTLTEDDRLRKFELKFSPWVRTLCQWFDDPQVDWIYLSMGSQVSKTTFMMGCLLYVSQYVRGAVPCLWVQAVEELAKVFIGKRLRPFLDNSGQEALVSGRWKNEAFRVYNSAVKVGISTSEATLRTHPARYIFGDEYSIWEHTISDVKTRARTFEGCRKGIFGSTPPKDAKHHSVAEIRSGNWWQWWVPCLSCSVFQPLIFSQLKWYEKENESDKWDHDRVRKTARYMCRHCNEFWNESEKLKIINAGKSVCVDCYNYAETEPRPCDSNTMQINGLYSMFTSWGKLASNFLTAKAGDVSSLKTFFTDELAEIPSEVGAEGLKELELGKYVSTSRYSGKQEGFAIYTAGIDVQRNGKLYYVIIGWKGGTAVSGHILKYGVVGWKDADQKNNWKPILQEFAPWISCLYCCAIDASDGFTSQSVLDFSYWAGKPFMPLKDTGSGQLIRVCRRRVSDWKSGANHGNLEALVINSAMIKDEIAAAFHRAPESEGAWTFPADTGEDFLRHMANEHRTNVRSNGRTVSKWIPRYAGAQQHWFSAVVYAAAAMEEQRYRIQTTMHQESAGEIKFRRVRSPGVNIWQ